MKQTTLWIMGGIWAMQSGFMTMYERDDQRYIQKYKDIAIREMQRTGIILGEGQWRKTTGRIWESIWNGQFFTIKGQNGFVDIQDVIHFSVAAMKVGKIGNRYILVSENVDYQLLFTQIAKSINKKSRFVIAPILLQKIYVYYDWIKSLITNSSRNLTNETLKISNVKFSFSNKKAIKELGINFTPINKTIDRISTSFLKTKNVNNNG